jgi:hypothetical protein
MLTPSRARPLVVERLHNRPLSTPLHSLTFQHRQRQDHWWWCNTIMHLSTITPFSHHAFTPSRAGSLVVGVTRRPSLTPLHHSLTITGTVKEDHWWWGLGTPPSL